MNGRRGFLGGVLAFLGLGGAAVASPAEPVRTLQPIQGARIKDIFPIRLWKLGDLDHRIYPTEAAVARLEGILSKWDKKSPLDIIWGPELKLEVHYLTADEIHAIGLNPEVKIVKS
jgi:hypothetical protein